MQTDHKVFKPFDRVLVRDTNGTWRIDFYSHQDKRTVYHTTLASQMIRDSDILPYEGNEHLLGTDQEPEEEIELEEGEYGFFARKSAIDDATSYSFGRFLCIQNDFMMNTVGFQFERFIRFSDFEPDDMEESCKHILCVKNGKVVRYKE